MTSELQAVRTRIARACGAADRNPQDVLLLAVSKAQPADKMRRLADAGVRDFGENYLQEALEKMSALGDLALTWHFVGRVQGNKARQVAERFDWVHSVDRLGLAERLSHLRPPSAAPLNVCVQVNVEGEASKGGVSEAQLLPLLESVASLPRLCLRGLMCLPSVGATGEVFERVRELAARAPMALDTLSMGMSGDFERAIASGATCVRVGTALFGRRPGVSG